MSVEPFHGAWEIFDVVNTSKNKNLIPATIHGAVFVLEKNGEILWELGPNVDSGFPLFLTQCYEVVHSFIGVCIQMGAVSGHIFEFWVDRSVPRDTMLLTSDAWCMLQCRQRGRIQPSLDFPYSLLSALEEGYFSDMKVPVGEGEEGTSACRHNGKQFHVHSVIFELTGCDDTKISKLESDVLEIVLYYLYSQSLPPELPMEMARKCIPQVPSCMTDLIKLLEDYVYRIMLREKIVKLVNEVHSSIDSMTKAFKEHAATIPSRFSFVAKLALRDAAVAFLKLTELCFTYGEASSKLTRQESLEILRYAKARLPIFLKQLVSLLRNIKSDFACLRPYERNEIASHVAPEIERLLGALSTVAKEGRDASNQIWTKWSENPNYPEPLPVSNEERFVKQFEGIDSLTEAIHAIFRKREVTKLHHLQSQLADIYLYLAQKKESFKEMSHAVKTRYVSRNLEQLLEELPVFLIRLEEIMIAFDDRFQWKDFKFCLQLVISQVCQTVHHMRRERSSLQKFFTLLSGLVQHDEFHQSLINLGLVDDASNQSFPVHEPEGNVESRDIPCQEAVSLKSSPKNPKAWYEYDLVPESPKNEGLNLIESICTPKISKESSLAQNSMALFETKSGADMVFDVVQDTDSVEIPAHRVIVAARCDWFRRALLSGMKESISKRISIHDCSVSMFQLFLRYIYIGQLPADTSLEILSDLIALADRFEMDNLKLYCEHELSVRHLDEASVIFLLSFADQYNARTLRSSTMEYIAANPEIMGKEMFEELSPELQMEVYDTTMWSKPKRYT